MNAEAVCGACGYSTIGLRELRCPECGGDLRSVGIYTPSTPRGRGIRFAGSAALFLVVFVGIAFMLTFLMIEVLPQRREFLQSTRFSGPASAAYEAVTITAHEETWGSGRLFMPVVLELELAPPSPPPTPLNVQASRLRPENRSAFTEAHVLELMKSAGIDTADKAVQTEARRIVAVARTHSRLSEALAGEVFIWSSSTDDMGTSPIFQHCLLTEKASSQTPPWVVFIICLIWVYVAAGGLRYLWRCTRTAQGFRM